MFVPISDFVFYFELWVTLSNPYALSCPYGANTMTPHFALSSVNPESKTTVLRILADFVARVPSTQQSILLEMWDGPKQAEAFWCSIFPSLRRSASV
jgi:hypothetical protein